MPVEPPFHTYREQLWPLYQGLALWKPNPGDLYDRVSIGDVGYVSEGAFIRMFNVRLPWDDESNRTFGIPDRYDPLGFGHLNIRRETFGEVDHYSRCVFRDENANNMQAASPEQADGVAYSCPGRGALLSLPHGGCREDAVQMKIFEKYIQDNVVSWFIWAQNNQLGVERMEDLILVSGCTLVTTWAAAVFMDRTIGAEISLASRTLSNGGANFVWSNFRGPIVHHNSRFDPHNSSTTPDQCVFIKGFRAKRVLFRIKPLRAAAEPLPDDPDNRRDGDIHVTPVPGVSKYRDPLIGVLDYIAEKCIEGATTEDVIAIAHDDDLHFIEDMQTLTADEIEKNLHERNMPLLVENGAAILRVPRNNTSLVSNEKQVASYEAAESNGEPLPLVFHPVLTNYYLKPETTEYINHDHDTSLLHLPPELISLTLQYLSPEDVISCRRTCRTMHNICNDPYLRYHVQMGRCGVSDDLRPGLCYSDRLRILERHEEAWAMLDFRNSVRVHVPFDSTDTYDFTGGTLLLGKGMCAIHDQPSVGYSYVSLPSLSVEQDQKLQWIERDIGIQILDVGLAVHEHDLIAVLTAKADDGDPSDRRMTSEIRLLRFSTGQPHPLAEQPIIFITRKSLLLGHCNIHIEIVGDFLALLITFPETRDEHADMFFLVRWKTGEARRFRFSDRRAHACFSFLSQDTLVIPNLIQFTLKIVKIVIRSDNIPILVPLCVLSLPPLTRRASIVGLDCRAEPNPTGPGPLAIPAPSNRPFRDKSEDAVILFNIRIHSGQSPQSRPFTFIVHRRVLLDHIPAAHRACAPFCSTPEPAPETVQVPWEAWGPSATRWFESDPASVSWITTTAGQRAVTMEDGASTPIIVRDFNPYAVRSARARAAAGGHLQQQCDWNEVLPNGNTMTLKVDDSVLVAGSVFKDDVRSSLPYVEIVTREEYHYEGVLIDEERILGLKTSHEDELMISSMDVHILG